MIDTSSPSYLGLELSDMADDPAPRKRLSWLSRVLLALSVLASVAVAVIVAFVGYLFVSGYSGGNDPTSVAPLAFPVAIIFFAIAGLPAILICAGLWVAHGVSVRRRR